MCQAAGTSNALTGCATTEESRSDVKLNKAYRAVDGCEHVFTSDKTKSSGGSETVAPL